MQADSPQAPQSLAELEARLARDLELLLIPPAKEWLQPTAHPRWGPLLDVAIIGAGMAAYRRHLLQSSQQTVALQPSGRQQASVCGPRETHPCAPPESNHCYWRHAPARGSRL